MSQTPLAEQVGTASDYVTGVVTYQRRLRMVTCGYTPTADYLENVATTLLQVSS